MPDDPDNAVVTDAFARIMAEQAARNRRAQEALAPNKAALFDALAAANVETLVVTFDGCGDSGQIESVAAHTGEAEVAMPETAITIASPRGDGSGLDHRAMPIAEAVETLVYDLLEIAHPGWEINEGSYGEFTFAVANREIRLECNLRTTEFSADEW